MLRSDYYREMRWLAHEKRVEYGIATRDITLSRIRQIYKQEHIQIDRCPRRLSKLKAAYFCDEGDCSILLNMSLPEEPRLFAMVHELKHHYRDQDRLLCHCSEVNDDSPMIEIGAEVFAAEFIFPEGEFEQYVELAGCSDHIQAEDIVRLKYYSPAIVSYQFVLKRLEWLQLIPKGQFQNTRFSKLHEQLFGSRYSRNRLQLF